MAMGQYLSIITLNVNGLNAPTERQRLTEWIKNKTPIYAVYKRPTSNLGTHTDWKWRDGKIFHANGDQKKSGIAIFISDKPDFKTETVKRDKDNDQTINSRRRYNNYEYICTQHRNTTICKTNANKYNFIF